MERVINTLPEHLGAEIDRYVIMPNHIHIIIVIPDSPEWRALREAPLHARSILAKTVGYIKMNASKIIHQTIGSGPVFQRSYHDHVIRDREDYLMIARYICDNPRHWSRDCYYE